MTNNHVLRSEDFARRSTAEFNFQLGDGGAQLPVVRFGLKPDAFFLTDRDLDFSLVAVEPRAANGLALASFGYCPLIGAEGKILVRDPVNIVQHPKGELKQIVIRNNTLLDLPEQPPLDKFAHYETDTEQGSSGSPVFNDEWEVIALHHSGVPRTNAAGTYPRSQRQGLATGRQSRRHRLDLERGNSDVAPRRFHQGRDGACT